MLLDVVRGTLLVDLGSSHGTRLIDSTGNVTTAVPFRAYSLLPDTRVQFGQFTQRTYAFSALADLEQVKAAELANRVATFASTSITSSSSSSSSSATTAITSSGGPMKGTSISASASSRGGRDEDLTVFARSIPVEASEAEVRSFFSVCGPIKKLSYPLDRETRQPRGIATVTFETSSGFVQGMSRDNDMLLGQAVRVKKSQPQAEDARRTNNSEVRMGHGSDRHRLNERNRDAYDDDRESSRDQDARSRDRDRRGDRDRDRDTYHDRQGDRDTRSRDRSRERDRDHHYKR